MKQSLVVTVCAIGLSMLGGCRAIWSVVASPGDPTDPMVVLDGFEWETPAVQSGYGYDIEALVVLPGDEPNTWLVFRSWDESSEIEALVVDDTGAFLRRVYMPRPPEETWGTNPLLEQLDSERLGVSDIPPGRFRLLRGLGRIRTRDFQSTTDGTVIVSGNSSNLRAIKWQTEAGGVLPKILDARLYNPLYWLLYPVAVALADIPLIGGSLEYRYQLFGPTQLRVFEYDSADSMPDQPASRTRVYRLEADVPPGRLLATTDRSAQWLYVYAAPKGHASVRHGALIRIDEATGARPTDFEESLLRARARER